MTKLEELPSQIENLTLHVLQLRTEMHVEFSALRAEMDARFGEVEARFGEVDARLVAVETRFTDLWSKVDSKIDSKVDGLASQMRTLHEDLIARIALLAEAQPAARRSRKRRK